MATYRQVNLPEFAKIRHGQCERFNVNLNIRGANYYHKKFMGELFKRIMYHVFFGSQGALKNKHRRA